MAKKTALIIYNPTAGLDSKSQVDVLIDQELAKLGFETDWFILDQHFEKNIQTYDLLQVKLVVAVGGDGTVKVAARLILDQALDVPLAILPFGSANVVAAEMGIPFKLKAALKVLAQYQKTKIDVGIINNRWYFLVGFSLGYVSQIVTGTTIGLKKRMGFIGYILSLFFNKFKIRKYKFRISNGKKTWWLRGNSLVVFNMVNYYGLKPKKIISPTDGLLNLYVLTNKTYLEMIKAFIYSLIFSRVKKLIYDFDSRYFKIDLRFKTKTCQLDGDYLELPKSLEVVVLPKKLTVISNL